MVGKARGDVSDPAYFYITFSPEFNHTQHTGFMKTGADGFDTQALLRQYEVALKRAGIERLSPYLHRANVRGPFETLAAARQDRDQLVAEFQSFGARVTGFIASTAGGVGLFSFRPSDVAVLRVWADRMGTGDGSPLAGALPDIVIGGTSDPRFYSIDETIGFGSVPDGLIAALDDLAATTGAQAIVLTVPADTAAGRDAVDALRDGFAARGEGAFKPVLLITDAEDDGTAAEHDPEQLSGGLVFLTVEGGDDAHDPLVDRIKAAVNGMLGINTPALVINEVMSSNSGYFVDEFGDDGDWIEIFNTGSDPVDMTGMYLSDDSTRLTKWRIPLDDDAEADIVQPGGFKVIWADGDTGKGANHANFKINRGGEDIVLTDVDGTTVIDHVALGQMQPDQSTGRVPDGSGILEIQGFPGPTPGAPNGAYLARGRLGQDHFFPSDIRVHVMDRKSNVDREGVPYLDSFTQSLRAFDTTAFEIVPGWTNWRDVADEIPHVIILHINGFVDPARPAQGIGLAGSFFAYAAEVTDAYFILYSGALSEEGSPGNESVMDYFTSAALENGVDVSGRVTTFALNWDWIRSPYPGARFPDPEIAAVLKQNILYQYRIARSQ